MPNGKYLGAGTRVTCIKPNIYKASYEGATFAVWDSKRVKIMRPSRKGDTTRLNQVSHQFMLGFEVRMRNNLLTLWYPVKGPDGEPVRQRVIWEESGDISLQFDRVYTV